MAKYTKTFTSSNYQMKAFQLLGLLCISLSLVPRSCNAAEFTIGGSKGWSIPTDPKALSYNQWAEKNRFQIGDSIVFTYPSGQDSVLQVSQEDYNNCNTDHPQHKLDDGRSVFTFKQSGPHYFISGNKDNCLKNEKVVVIVLADRSNNQTNAASPAPPPSGAAGTNPSPAPEGQAPPSPPTGTVEINPTPAPVSDQPPNPNGATFAYMSFLGCIGAFATSSLVLVF